jgi:hypothetical protein
LPRKQLAIDKTPKETTDTSQANHKEHAKKRGFTLLFLLFHFDTLSWNIPQSNEGEERY